MAPYEALYGRPCRSLVCWTKVGERPTTGLNSVRDTSEKVNLIGKRLLTARSQQKSYADRRRWPLEFEVRDHVFLKVMPREEWSGSIRGESYSRGISGPSRYLRG